MSRLKVKFPTVFIACPFNDDMKKLITELKKFPWKIHAANEEINSDILLKKITNNIRNCDFALFDISGWNHNVFLELGLAEGLKKDYYILNNISYKRGVISDIEGIGRIDYNWNKTKKAASLYNQIKEGIFKKQFYSAHIWNTLNHHVNAEKMFILSLNICCSFKTSRKNLTRVEIKELGRGLNLRKPDYDEVIDVLLRLKLIKKIQRSGAITIFKKIYQH